MVAEFVARQSGSPINGETPLVQPLDNTMPSSQSNMPNGPYVEMGAAATPAVSPAPSPNPDSSDHSEMLFNGDSNFPGDFQGGSAQSNYDLSNHLKRKELFSQRKQREFIPDNKKDESYWDRRRRNNEAAKRSREKRRYNDMILEQRVVDLTKENHVLKAQLQAIKEKYGINGESLISVEQVMATLPTSDQVLSITKRSKIIPPTVMGMGCHPPASNNGSAPLLPPPTPSVPVHRQVLVNNPAMYASPPCQSPPPRSQNIPPATPPHPIPTSVIHEPMSVDSSKYNNDLSPNPYSDGPSMAFPDQEVYPYHQYQPHLLPPLVSPAMHHHPSVFSGVPSSMGSLVPSIVRPPSPPIINIGSPAAPPDYEENNSVLNLSRSRTESPQSAVTPHELSSGDEGSPAMYTGSNLPHKLRHKSHLGDKDAASALLSLQNIKQEPRASPPWDTEGSSDERDSGISLGSEWHGTGPGGVSRRPEVLAAAEARKRTRHSTEESERSPTPPPETLQCENSQLKNQLAKLASEVASLKSILTKKKTATTMAPSYEVP
ncbi:nuclear factor interleukin-3-regulated protein [Ischnura elegans]|uniref:nuclear factor interleukin-3-regulated protein n=1 Tax=Ischnura elegans TaxID=197161 RepID=UPI001ED8685F|nr:nuclear factor interleukin-3-regulated protein [Ischnura elegans]